MTDTLRGQVFKTLANWNWKEFPGSAADAILALWEAREAELVAKLEPYLMHSQLDCEKWEEEDRVYYELPEKPCTCGLDAARARLNAARSKWATRTEWATTVVEYAAAAAELDSALATAKKEEEI